MISLCWHHGNHGPFPVIGCLLKLCTGRSGGWLEHVCRHARYATSSGDDTSFKNYYKVLGVSRNASRGEIKAAFLAAAKRHHPDVADRKVQHQQMRNGRQKDDVRKWLEIMDAYKVLGNPQSRVLYDLTLCETHFRSVLGDVKGEGATSGQGPPWRSSAQDGDKNNDENPWASFRNKQNIDYDMTSYGSDMVHLRYGLGSITSTMARSERRQISLVDKVRDDLRQDLQIALKKACFGPDIDKLLLHHLPDAFEAEERSDPQATEHVLAIVSGRYLLGSVKESQFLQLDNTDFIEEADTPNARDYKSTNNNVEEENKRNICYKNGSWDPNSRTANFELPPFDGAGGANQNTIEDNHFSPNIFLKIRNMIQNFYSRKYKKTNTKYHSKYYRSNRKLQVLSFILQDKTVAQAVRKANCVQDEIQIYIDGQHLYNARYLARNNLSGENPVYEGRENVEEYTQDNQLWRAIGIFETCTGYHTHTAIQTYSPLVRHIIFVYEGNSNHRSQRIHERSDKIVVARCHRAWLPPSHFWVFPPRSADFDIGGWSIEWSGYSQKDVKAWLHPALIVLIAAFDTLENEMKS